MFGVDFSELMVILVVALVVIGPERLSKVARTFGHLLGRTQRYVNSVKTDIAREMSMEELQQLQQKMNQEVLRAQQAAIQITQPLNQHGQQAGSTVAQPVPQAPLQQAQPGLPSAGQKKPSVD